MNLRQHKRRAAAGLTRRFLLPAVSPRFRTVVRIYVGWVRVNRLDGGIRWVHTYTGVARNAPVSKA